MPEPPEELTRLAQERARARAAKDFAKADALREEIAAAGWTVVDDPTGFRLDRAEPEPATDRRMAAAEVESVLEQPPSSDVSVHWLVEGWPEDVERGLTAFRAHAGAHDVQLVVTDVTGEDPARWGGEVETVRLEKSTGWGAARNAGLRRSTGRVVIVVDGSVEPAGDVLGPVVEALSEDKVGVCGPFGITTKDLREFDEAGPGEVDAIEGYFMAFRREILSEVGMFDEKFKWYRTADIEFSFRIKDQGYRAVVVELPVRKHEHRMWFNTDPAERARWSKRNYYRFLDRWRDRWDLCVSPDPPEHDHGPGHRHEHGVT
ncbi:MAG TPA: glycosyltransferase [Actinomycetota bacterium]|jgi:cysteinyl-tRNA synthetase